MKQSKPFELSANINRRHLTKGQRAKATAKIQPEPSRGRGAVDEVGKAAETAGISQRRIREARLVLRYAPDLADAVLSGATMLDSAYETATKRKREAEAHASDSTVITRRLDVRGQIT